MGVFKLHHRFAVSPSTLETIKSHCEPSEDFSYIGAKKAKRPQWVRKWFLKGVPGNQVSILLLEEWDGTSETAVEIGIKDGRYGGQRRGPAKEVQATQRNTRGPQEGQRWEIVLRHWYEPRIQPLPSGGILFSSEEDTEQAAVAAHWNAMNEQPAGSWMEVFTRLRSDIREYDPRAILLWHWRNYYTIPLQAADLEGPMATFLAAFDPDGDLAAANRLASRLLYAEARNRGWRKLTLREQVRYGLSGQWHLDHLIQRRRIDMGYQTGNGLPSGVGEYTDRAAEGDQDYVRTAHGVVDIE